MKKILMILAVIFLSGCAAERSETGELIDFLPANSAVILKLQNPDLFFNNLRNNLFLKNNRSEVFSEELEKELDVLTDIPHRKPALLSFSPGKETTEFLFITKEIPQTFHPDSLGYDDAEDMKVGPYSAKKFLHKEQPIFMSIKDSVLFMSNSSDLLGKSLSQQTFLTDSPDFRKVLKAASNERPVIFINHQSSPELLDHLFLPQFLKNFSSLSNWTSLEADISQGSIRLNGITTETGTTSGLINVFRKVDAAENKLGSIAPVSAGGFSSLTFTNFEQLRMNLRSYSKDTAAVNRRYQELLENSEEAGMVWFKDRSAFAIRSKDMEAARLSISPEAVVAEDFREIEILELARKFDASIFEPIFNPGTLKYAAFLNNFIVFSGTPEAIKEIIAAAQNEQVFSKNKAFLAVSNNLSSESSMLIISRNEVVKEKLLDRVSSEEKLGMKDFSFEGYPFSALQFIYQDNFAHVHAVLAKNEEPAREQAVSQNAAVSLSAEVAAGPFFFRNHRSNGLDIVVQDEQNTLYLISPKGKIYWKKKIGSRILGEVHSVDLFRNGRMQMAFTTHDAVHVLDRDGNRVDPFPLQFRDAVTQPLAVFDYDNNRDYRFVVVQERDVFMFDRKGRRVTGFNFDRASGKITNSPKHIRIGRKDYILIPEASGKLNILSRTGEKKIIVNKSLEMSDNEWYEHKGHFITSSASGEKLIIGQEGEILKEELNLAGGHKVAATEKFFVTLSENELVIQDTKVSLDFGLYTAPRIFSLNNKIYVGLTDLQSKKVYVFDSAAQLLPGFPVYGTSALSLGNADSDAAMELVVQGEEDSVLLYKIK